MGDHVQNIDHTQVFRPQLCSVSRGHPGAEEPAGRRAPPPPSSWDRVQSPSGQAGATP